MWDKCEVTNPALSQLSLEDSRAEQWDVQWIDYENGDDD